MYKTLCACSVYHLIFQHFVHKIQNTNDLFYQPTPLSRKHNSTDRRVIMDPSWPLPPLISINSGTPRESFLGSYKKMHLPSAQDFCNLIRTAGKGCYMYSADVAQVYRQLPLDPGRWFASPSKGLTTLTSASPLASVGRQLTAKMSGSSTAGELHR